MTADDLIPCSFPPSVMSSPSLYLPFMSVQERGIVTTQRPTHLKDSTPAPEAPCQRNPPEQVSVVGCSSRDTVNPSLPASSEGAGIRTVGDRRRVFNENTKMKSETNTPTRGQNTKHRIDLSPRRGVQGWGGRCPPRGTDSSSTVDGFLTSSPGGNHRGGSLCPGCPGSNQTLRVASAHTRALACPMASVWTPDTVDTLQEMGPQALSSPESQGSVSAPPTPPGMDTGVQGVHTPTAKALLSGTSGGGCHA